MRLLSKIQAQSLDHRTTHEFGISSSTLIQKAGENSAQWLEQKFRKRNRNHNCYFVFLIGPGNNGKDGEICAESLRRTLNQASITVIPYSRLQSDLLNAEEILKLNSFVFEQSSTLIIVDAIFGTGMNKALNANMIENIKFFNCIKNAFRVSLDISTGLDADTGQSWGAIFHAHYTLTFGRPKIGMFVNNGPGHSGKIQIIEMGFPKELVREIANNYCLYKKRSASIAIPKKDWTFNKSKSGHALLISGSDSMPGAAILAANAAARMGAGYVTLGSYIDNPLWPPDFLRLNLKVLAKSPVTKELLQRYDAVAVGPGLGLNHQARAAFEFAFRASQIGVPLIVDADAITIYLEFKRRGLLQHRFCEFNSNILFTPHAGELSRILNWEVKKIESDRWIACEMAAKKLGCLVLLKGYRSLLSNGVQTFVIETGNEVLAKAGTGDVLTGIILGLVSQKIKLSRSALIGSTFHGWMGDSWIQNRNDVLSLRAMDLIERMPSLLRKFRDL